MRVYIWDGSEDWSGKVFKGNFKVDKNVSSLKGCPEKVNTLFTKNCRKLKVLDDIPKDFLVLILFSPIKDFDVSIIEKVDINKLDSIYVEFSSNKGYISLPSDMKDKIITLKKNI